MLEAIWTGNVIDVEQEGLAHSFVLSAEAEIVNEYEICAKDVIPLRENFPTILNYIAKQSPVIPADYSGSEGRAITLRRGETSQPITAPNAKAPNVTPAAFAT